MLSRTLTFTVLFCALDAVAQVPGPEIDASIPDASVGIGGAETSQEMDDGQANTVCAQSRDCERGFTCNGNRCTYLGYRTATQPGCFGASAMLVFPLLFVWRARARRQRRT